MRKRNACHRPNHEHESRHAHLALTKAHDLRTVRPFSQNRKPTMFNIFFVPCDDAHSWAAIEPSYRLFAYGASKESSLENWLALARAAFPSLAQCLTRSCVTSSAVETSQKVWFGEQDASRVSVFVFELAPPQTGAPADDVVEVVYFAPEVRQLACSRERLWQSADDVLDVDGTHLHLPSMFFEERIAKLCF